METEQEYEKEIADEAPSDYQDFLKSRSPDKRTEAVGYETEYNESQPLVPAVIYSLSFDAEQLLTVYGALTTYLKVLSQQESQDFETIKQVSTMLIEIKPRAVEASKSLTLKAAVVKERNGAD